MGFLLKNESYLMFNPSRLSVQSSRIVQPQLATVCHDVISSFQDMQQRKKMYFPAWLLSPFTQYLLFSAAGFSVPTIAISNTREGIPGKISPQSRSWSLDW